MADPESAAAGPTDAPRRFRLLDAMILIIAIAAGFAVGRAAFLDCYLRRPIPPVFRASYAVQCGHAVAFPCIASLSVGYLVLRPPWPRPPVSQVMRRPGVVACWIALLCLATGGIAAERSGVSVRPSSFAFVLSPFVGMAVAVGWLWLWWEGWWRPEPGWLGRMGIVLGVCWIGMPLLLGSAFLL